MKDKFETEADTVVGEMKIFDSNNAENIVQNNSTIQDGKVFQDLTLKEAFRLYGRVADKSDFTVDRLGVQAGSTQLFHNWEKFDEKRNLFGSRALREIFLKSDNAINGRFYGELLQDTVFKRNIENCVYSEYRVSFYGASDTEWQRLADFVLKHSSDALNVGANCVECNKDSCKGGPAKFVVQIPRDFKRLRRKLIHETNDKIKKDTSSDADFEAQRIHVNDISFFTFQEYLARIFQPLFAATLDPEAHPKLAAFLKDCVSGFDSVGDEKEDSTRHISYFDTPDKCVHNPPYAYYLYYMYANIMKLNFLRQCKGLNTFLFRPHAGETGPTGNHLCASFLVAHSISHGVGLKRNTVLCYLYYLAQIGVAMSPLSNNALFLELKKSPFVDFFKIGINVSLATDMPVLFHTTGAPLLEEYTIAQQYWKLSLTDICEVAQNSVLQSGLSAGIKQVLLGDHATVKTFEMDVTPSELFRILERRMSKDIQPASSGSDNDANGNNTNSNSRNSGKTTFWWNDESKSNLADVRVSFRRRCWGGESEFLNFFIEADEEDTMFYSSAFPAAIASANDVPTSPYVLPSKNAATGYQVPPPANTLSSGSAMSNGTNSTNAKSAKNLTISPVIQHIKPVLHTPNGTKKFPLSATNAVSSTSTSSTNQILNAIAADGYNSANSENLLRFTGTENDVKNMIFSRAISEIQPGEKHLITTASGQKVGVSDLQRVRSFLKKGGQRMDSFNSQASSESRNRMAHLSMAMEKMDSVINEQTFVDQRQSERSYSGDESDGSKSS